MRFVMTIRTSDSESKTSFAAPCDGYYTDIRVIGYFAGPTWLAFGPSVPDDLDITFATGTFMMGDRNNFEMSILQTGPAMYTKYSKNKMWVKRGEMIQWRVYNESGSTYYLVVTGTFVPKKGSLLKQTILTSIAATDDPQFQRDSVTSYPTSIEILAESHLISLNGYIIVYDADNDALGEIEFQRTRSRLGIDEKEHTFSFTGGDVFDKTLNVGGLNISGDNIAMIPYAVQQGNVNLNEFFIPIEDRPKVYAGDVIAIARNNLLTTNPGTLVMRLTLTTLISGMYPYSRKGQWIDMTGLLDLNIPEVSN